MNLPDATSLLVCWCLTPFRIGFYVVHLTGIEQQAVDSLSRLKTTGADTKSIKDDLLVAAIYTNVDCDIATKMRIENNEQALSQIVMDNGSSKKEAVSTIAESLQHQTTYTYSKQSAQNVVTANAKGIIDMNGLSVRISPVDSTLQSSPPQTLRNRLLYNSNHPVIASRAGQRHMQDFIKR